MEVGNPMLVFQGVGCFIVPLKNMFPTNWYSSNPSFVENEIMPQPVISMIIPAWELIGDQIQKRKTMTYMKQFLLLPWKLTQLWAIGRTLHRSTK
jgi:hypothetical protein